MRSPRLSRRVRRWGEAFYILYAQSPLVNANDRTLRGERLIDVGALRWWPPRRALSCPVLRS
jgi:hypothetical protein